MAELQQERAPTHCPHCEVQLRLWDNRCPNCERDPLDEAEVLAERAARSVVPTPPKGMVYCRVCGKVVADGAGTCPHCGIAQPTPGSGPALLTIQALCQIAIAIALFMFAWSLRGCGSH